MTVSIASWIGLVWIWTYSLNNHLDDLIYFFGNETGVLIMILIHINGFISL